MQRTNANSNTLYSFDQVATLLRFEPSSFHTLMKDSCGWLDSEPRALKIGHLVSEHTGDRLLDFTRDLLAIAGSAELIRRQRYRVATTIVDALNSFRERDRIRWRAYNTRLLLEVCGICTKVANVVSTQGGQLFKSLEKECRAGRYPTEVFDKTPYLLKSLWERAERTGVDWIHLIETGEFKPYDRADIRFSDIADFRDRKDSIGELLASIEDAVRNFEPLSHVDFGSLYTFLSEFVHPNRGAFMEVEQQVAPSTAHPHLHISEIAWHPVHSSDWSEDYRELRMATEKTLSLMQRYAFIFGAYTSGKLKAEELALRKICQTIIRYSLDFRSDIDRAAIFPLLPTGRCICLAPVDPSNCCLAKE